MITMTKPVIKKNNKLRNILLITSEFLFLFLLMPLKEESMSFFSSSTKDLFQFYCHKTLL